MMRLFTVPTANGQKAQVVLDVLGLAYETASCDLVAGEHRTPEMLERNPFGKLPFLEHDARTVYGSMAIALYLADLTGKLMPADPGLRAEVYQWAGMLASDLSPALAGQFMFSEIFPVDDPQVVGYFTESACRLFEVLNQHLAGREVMVGDDLTVADLLAYPSAITSAARLPEQLEPYPHIRAWAERLGENEAIRRGMERT